MRVLIERGSDPRPDVITTRFVDRFAHEVSRRVGFELVEDVDHAERVVQTNPFQRRPDDVPSVVMVGDLSVVDHRWAFDDERRLLVRTLHKNLLRADRVVCLGDEIAGRLHEIEPLAVEKTIVVDRPPLSSYFGAAEEATAEDRKEVGGSTILAPMALAPERGDWCVLDAFAELSAARPDVSLRLCGRTGTGWSDQVGRRLRLLGVNDLVELSDDRLDPGCRTGTAGVVVAAGVATTTSRAIELGADLGCSLVVSDTMTHRAQVERASIDADFFDPYDPVGLRDVLVSALDRGSEDSRRQRDDGATSWATVLDAALGDVGR